MTNSRGIPATIITSYRLDGRASPTRRLGIAILAYIAYRPIRWSQDSRACAHAGLFRLAVRSRRILASRAAPVALLQSLSAEIFRNIKEVPRDAGGTVRIPGTLSRVGELSRAAKRERVRPISLAEASFPRAALRLPLGAPGGWVGGGGRLRSALAGSLLSRRFYQRRLLSAPRMDLAQRAALVLGVNDFFLPARCPRAAADSLRERLISAR
jgi:hypothetical protein